MKAFRHFQRVVMTVMSLDTVLFIFATVENSNQISHYQRLLFPMGIVLLLIGRSIRAVAIKALGLRGYYWSDFFLPEDHSMPVQYGIYRNMKNPMYDGGYLHAYGFACISWTGLALAALMQLTIKVFGHSVERQNFQRNYGSLQQRVHRGLATSILDR